MAVGTTRKGREVPRTKRLTQAERVQAMRNRLLDATVECLTETGFNALTTNDVVKRAGVSRGALAHHFPTRADLVAAAAQRLIAESTTDFRYRFQALPAEQRTIPAALDLLWSYFEGPTFVALLELTVAARTEPDLRAVFSDAPDHVIDQTMAVVAELFPDLADRPFIEETVAALLAAYTGLAVQEWADGDVHGRHAAVRRLFRTVASGMGRRTRHDDIH